MGFGAAFATGLVQGFTQNIQEEKARRLADQQKIDALSQLLAKSAMDKDSSKSGREAVAKLIKSAQQDLNSREPIDIFGRQTDGLDIDFTKLAGLVNSDEVKYKTIFGDVGFTNEWDGSAKSARMWLPEVAGYLQSQENVDKLQALDNNTFRKLVSSVNAARTVIVKDARQNVGEGLFSEPDVEGKLPTSAYFGLSILDDIAKKREGGSLYDYKNPQSPNANPDSVAQAQAIADAEEEAGRVRPDSVGVTSGEPDENGNVARSFITGLTDKEKKSLTAIASKYGYNDPTSFLGYWQKTLAKFPDATNEEKTGWLNASILIHSEISDIETLDPEDKLRLLTQDRLDSIYKKILTYTGGDITAMIFALAPAMTADIEKVQGSPGQKTLDRRMTIQKYILRKIYGEDKADTVSFDDLRQQQTALDQTITALAELDAAWANLGPEGKEGNTLLAFEKFTTFFKENIFGEAGLIGAIGDEIKATFITVTGAANVGDNKNLTTGYVDSLQERVNKLEDGSERGSKLARLEAMRISLAFQMARAADPSGRLSNQDIELQLRKLGTSWQTVNQARSALGVARKEFTRKQQQYAVLVKYGEANKTGTVQDFKIVDAAIAIDYMSRNAGTPAAAPTTAPPATPQFNVDDYMIIDNPDGSKTVVDGTYKTVTDPALISAILEAEGR